MAELNARIIAKASAVSGESPQAADLEVAEIAVNTADGKFFTKHTDGTIKEISGGGGSGGSGGIEEAPEDGTPYARQDAGWVSAPTGGGGGGGAVDSVNGETGVVSLGIQDMDDFELTGAGGRYVWPNKSNSGDVSTNRGCPNPGDWAAWSTGGDTYVYLHNDSFAQLLTVGEVVTLTIETGESYKGVITSNTTTQPSWAIVFADSQELTAIASASLGTALTIDSKALPGGTPSPLAEGDILAWDDLEQKFKPVRQRIQDMDDFGLASAPAEYTLSGPTTNDPDSLGEWGIGQQLNNYFTWWTGDPVNVMLSALESGATVQFETEGGYVHEAVISQSATESGASSDYMSFGGYSWPSELTDAFSSSQSLIIRSPGFSLELPLSDGEVLIWNASNGKWNPDNAGTLISKVTLKAAVAASTDFADFQSRIAAL